MGKLSPTWDLFHREARTTVKRNGFSKYSTFFSSRISKPLHICSTWNCYFCCVVGFVSPLFGISHHVEYFLSFLEVVHSTVSSKDATHPPNNFVWPGKQLRRKFGPGRSRARDVEKLCHPCLDEWPRCSHIFAWHAN